MDIHSLSATLSQQLANNSDSAKLAEKLLALEAKTGTLVQALVTQVVALSDREQQSLLQQLKLELQSQQQKLNLPAGTSVDPGKTNAQASANKEQQTSLTSQFADEQPGNQIGKQIASLQARIGLLENALQTKALLQLISLKLGVQEIKTLSELPVKPGDRIQLSVRADGQLNLLAPRKAEISSSPAQTSFTSPRNIQNDLQQIAESLRQHLPRSLEKIQSMQSLDKLLQTLNRMQAPVSKQVVAEPTQQLIARLLTNTLQPLNLQTQNRLAGVQIKEALLNSGSLLESSLRVLLAKIRDQWSGPGNINSSNAGGTQPVKNAGFSNTRLPGNLPASFIERALSLTSSPNHSQSRTIQGSTPPPTQTPSANHNSLEEDSLFEKDNKAILLRLLEQLSSGTTANDNSRQNTQRALHDPLIAVLRSLGLKPQNDNSTQNLQRELTNELKQLVNSTLARIQTLQLRSLNQALSEFSPALLPAVELSIRVNDNIYPLVLYFQEKLLKEKQLEEEEREKDKRKRKLSRQWKVFMQFEMDDCGWFASEVSLLDEKVSTRFWAERNTTKNLMRTRLEALKQKMEASGLDVEEIQLLAGEPPVPNTSIQQNLVDIQT